LGKSHGSTLVGRIEVQVEADGRQRRGSLSCCLRKIPEIREEEDSLA
jgi:hypothetical protein